VTWELVFAHYGPFAFGLFGAVMLWERMVRPELAALRDAAANHALTAQALRDTAQLCREALRDARYLAGIRESEGRPNVR
jgi:hypothetical protein